MIDFGLVDALDSEAIGPPGQRTFRLRARTGDSYAALWMEKEALATLGRSLSQLLADRSRLRGQAAPPVEPVGNFPQRPQVELQVARLGLDYDADRERAIIVADDAPTMERGDTPAFRMEIARAHVVAAVRQIEGVVAAGRPLCPLCHQALEQPGQAHFCPGHNGYSADLELPPIDGDDDEDDE